MRRRRKLKNALIGLVGILSSSSITGCKTISLPKGLIDHQEKPKLIYHEIFRPDDETNKQLSLEKLPSDINVNYNIYDERNKLKIIGDRAYPKDEPAQIIPPLEETVDVIPMERHKIPLINATYIEHQRTINELEDYGGKSNTTGTEQLREEKTMRTIDEIILNYKCRVPPGDLKRIIEPYIPAGIEINEFKEGNMLIFRGEKQQFGDFSYFCSILNQYDVCPEQIRLKLAILEFFKDNTYDREGIMNIYDKNDKLILNLKLPSSSTGEPLEFGVGFNPLYGVGSEYYSFDSFVKFLDSKGHAEILSEIDVMLSNGKPVAMKNVSLIPYLKSILSKEALIETLEYMETGPMLEATTFCNEEGFITLRITKAQHGEHTGFAGTVQRPTFRTADLTGEYTLQNGQTYITMRSITSRYKSVRRGLPLLNKIPIIKDISALSYERNASNLIYLVEARRIPRGDLTGVISK